MGIGIVFHVTFAFIVTVTLLALTIPESEAVSQFDLKDSDFDGIPDIKDMCKHSDETYNNFEDTDGCPDTNPQVGKHHFRDPINPPDVIVKSYKDTTQDGVSAYLIFKYMDLLYAGSETRWVYTETHLDTDKDGIPNNQDECTYDREMHNGYKDWDGCPDQIPLISYKEMAKYVDLRASDPESQGSYLQSYSDSDKDGIPDHIDECTFHKEIYNEYNDRDGCPDKIPTLNPYKEMVIGLEKSTKSKLDYLAKGVQTAENSLYTTWSDNSAAQEQIDNAWESLWWAKKYLAEAESSYNNANLYLEDSQFEIAYKNYNNAIDAAEKIVPKLYEITSYINSANFILKGN